MKTRLIKVRDCRDVARHLCENLDYEMNSRECREIRRHLRACPNCSAYLDSLKKTLRLYRKLPDPRVPSKVRKKLHAVLKFGSGGR